jgi:hypothetical protein
LPPAIRSGAEGEDDYVLFEVVDTGLGLPPIVTVMVGRLSGGRIPKIVDDKQLG